MWWVAAGSWPAATRHRHHVSRTNRTLLDVSCVALLQIDEIAIFILRTIIQIMKRSTLMGYCKHCKRWSCTFKLPWLLNKFFFNGAQIIEATISSSGKERTVKLCIYLKLVACVWGEARFVLRVFHSLVSLYLSTRLKYSIDAVCGGLQLFAAWCRHKTKAERCEAGNFHPKSEDGGGYTRTAPPR